MADPDRYLTDDQVRVALRGGPDPKGAIMVVLAGRIYKREGNRWRLLDNKSYRSVKDMVNNDGST